MTTKNLLQTQVELNKIPSNFSNYEGIVVNTLNSR